MSGASLAGAMRGIAGRLCRRGDIGETGATKKEPVAQVVEHLTFNQVVLGSSPSGLTK
jgi:hypothetical protein